jgi:hypothetical protein
MNFKQLCYLFTNDINARHPEVHGLNVIISNVILVCQRKIENYQVKMSLALAKT